MLPHLLLSLLLATRVGGLGILVTAPNGWDVVHPDHIDPDEATYIVKLQHDDAVLSIARSDIPSDVHGMTNAEIARSLREALAEDTTATSTTVAGAPALDVGVETGLQTMIVHGGKIYTITLIDAAKSKDGRAAYDALLRSIAWSDAPIRVEGGGFSLLMPNDWQLREAQGEGEQRDTVVLHVGHGVSTLQVSRNALPREVDHTPVTLAKGLAAATSAMTKMQIDEEPHAITVAGAPGAAWTMHLDEEDASYRLHLMLLVRGNIYYYTAFTAEADDEEDVAAYERIVKTIALK
jgi:hypothetical protein